MRIGIDIDDTVALTHDMLIEAAIKFDKEFVEGRGFRNKNAHKFNEMFYWRTENVKAFFDYIGKQKLFLNNIEPRENAVEIINKLYEEKHKIIFITRRNSKGCSRGCTKKWLKKEGFKFHKVIMDCEEKGEMCKKKKIDLFIDDSSVHIYEAIAENIDALLIDTPRNKSEKKLKRVKGWPEIYKYINEKVD